MTVQIEIDEELLAEADALARDLQIDRSEIFQNTLQEVLRKLRLVEKDRKTIESYKHFPQKPEEYENLAERTGLGGRMIQGDVYRYKFKEPDKRRPVLILTRSSLIPELNAITVVPITTTSRDAGTQVVIDEGDGMSEVSAINLASIQTVPKEKISGYITHLSDERMQEVFEAIRYTFEFDK